MSEITDSSVAVKPKKSNQPVKTRRVLTDDERRKRDALRSVKLKELGDARVNTAIKRISLCGNLAAYKPTEDQAIKIIRALHEAVSTVEARLSGNHGPSIFNL